MLSGALNALVGYSQSAKILKGVREDWVKGLENRVKNLQEVIKDILDVE